MDSIRVSEALDSSSILDETTTKKGFLTGNLFYCRQFRNYYIGEESNLIVRLSG